MRIQHCTHVNWAIIIVCMAGTRLALPESFCLRQKIQQFLVENLVCVLTVDEMVCLFGLLPEEARRKTQQSVVSIQTAQKSRIIVESITERIETVENQLDILYQVHWVHNVL